MDSGRGGDLLEELRPHLLGLGAPCMRASAFGLGPWPFHIRLITLTRVAQTHHSALRAQYSGVRTEASELRSQETGLLTVGCCSPFGDESTQARGRQGRRVADGRLPFPNSQQSTNYKHLVNKVITDWSTMTSPQILFL